MEKTYQVRRLNAVKHGILSKEAVLPHESKDGFAGTVRSGLCAC